MLDSFPVVYHWRVKNGQTYFAVQMVTAFLSSWGMPLIFVISGASTFYSLGKRRPLAFVQERTARLFVPLGVGIFTYIAASQLRQLCAFTGQ